MIDDVLRPPSRLLFVLLDDRDVASVVELGLLGVLVGVDELVLLILVCLFLQLPVAAVGNRLLQDLALLWIVVDRRLP